MTPAEHHALLLSIQSQRARLRAANPLWPGTEAADTYKRLGDAEIAMQKLDDADEMLKEKP